MLDPALHPFEKAREYTRALNATKLERMFAKPFLAQLGDGLEPRMDAERAQDPADVVADRLG